jgi:hypothetical protein
MSVSGHLRPGADRRPVLGRRRGAYRPPGTEGPEEGARRSSEAPPSVFWGSQDRVQVFEVLSAYVRTTSHRPPVGPAGSDSLQVRQADVHAALTVLARRTVLAGDPPLDLSGSVLPEPGSAGPGCPRPISAAPTSAGPASSTPTWSGPTWSRPCSAAPSCRGPTSAEPTSPGPGPAPTPAGPRASTGAPPAPSWSSPARRAVGPGPAFPGVGSRAGGWGGGSGRSCSGPMRLPGTGLGGSDRGVAGDGGRACGPMSWHQHAQLGAGSPKWPPWARCCGRAVSAEEVVHILVGVLAFWCGVGSVPPWIRTPVRTMRMVEGRLGWPPP